MMKLDPRLLKRAWSARFNLIMTVVLGFFTGIVIVLQARGLSRVVSAAFLEGAALPDVQPILIALLLLSLLRAASTWGKEISAQQVANHVKSHLRRQLSTHLLHLGPAFTSGERSGELSNTLLEGVEALDAYFRQYLPQLAIAALVPCAILIFVFPLDLTSGVVLLLTAPLIPLFMALIGSTAERLTRRQWKSLGRLSAEFLDALQGLTTLKLLNRSREQIERLRQTSDGYRIRTMQVLRVAFLSALVLEMVATISTAIVAVQVGLRLLYGRLVFEQAFFVLILAPEFYIPLRQLGVRFHAGMAGVAAAERIYEVLNTPLQGSRPTLRPAPYAQPFQSRLRFDQVHYAYAEGTRDALKGVSFHINRGERVAIVGPSGSGKTTVIHLLMCFLHAQRGTILVDERPLDSLDEDAWRSQIAWVPQTPFLFHGSVADNIRFARPGASMDQIASAARAAHAHGFIQSLPQGYATHIGERGARLSGGQAQRLALARAFLKDAPFLILDEPAANLDPETEYELQLSIRHLLKDRTALIIAHRLNTVTGADRILVLIDGEVRQSDPHDQLAGHPGPYQRMMRAYRGGI
jgi:ATP-binding cassette subfamily C protein CydD